MSSILVLSQTDINKLLAQGDAQVANQVVDLMEDTFIKYTAGHDNEEKAKQAQSPQRIGVSTESHQVLFMPSRLGSTTSIKIVSVPTKDGLSGLPATNIVIDEKTGGVEAVMNADALTAVRTAAGNVIVLVVCVQYSNVCRIWFGYTLLCQSQCQKFGCLWCRCSR